MGCSYWSFYLDKKQIGRVVLDKNFIKYIYIKPEYRGEDLSIRFWNLVENELLNKGVTTFNLIAEELPDKTGKLVRHYQKMGLQINGKDRYVDRDGTTVRLVPMIKNHQRLQDHLQDS